MGICRGVTLVCALLLLGLSARAQHEYANEGAQACLACHESERIMGIRETPHADFDNPRSPAARQQCESCHGPSARHMQFPMHVGNIRFSTHDASAPVDPRNATCMKCHGTSEHHEAWENSPHGFEGIALEAPTRNLGPEAALIGAGK